MFPDSGESERKAVREGGSEGREERVCVCVCLEILRTLFSRRALLSLFRLFAVFSRASTGTKREESENRGYIGLGALVVVVVVQIVIETISTLSHCPSRERKKKD